ncbi:MAG: histidine kinase N-terminal 7TM domain-containing protein [Halobellus sp.]|uniref:histidine kinase N-terminal 7TM domain-containing protein n=1 Tax=Halobellus sp. TaxID=1979212 RepID=UPI0035D3E7C2
MTLPSYLLFAITGYVLAAVSTVTLTGYVVWRHRDGSTERAFGAVVGAIALTTIAFSARLLAPELDTKLLWEVVGYAGLVSLPAAFLVFTLRFTGRHEWVSRPVLAALSVHPVFTLFALATNSDHGLFYEGVNLTQVGDMTLLVWTTANAGPAFWIHTAYSYGILLVATVLLLRFAVTSNRLYRAQTAAIIIGGLVPWTVNVAVVSDIGPAYIDLTPLGFALGITVLSVGVFRYQLLDLVPVARQRLVESLDDAVFVLDADGRVVETNPAGRASVCLRPGVDDPVGEPLQSVLRDELAEKSIFESTESECTIRVDGDERHLWARTMPVTGPGTQDVAILTVTDVTDRRHRERELEDISDRLESFIEAAPVAILAVDPAGEVTLWNSAAEEIFGWSEAEVLGEFNPVIPDENRDGQSELRERAFNGESLSKVELQRRTKDGTRLDVTLSSVPLHDADGDLIEVVAFLNDVTERKEALRGLRESERSLRELYRITSDTDLSFEEKLNRILELGRERLDLPFAFLTRIDDDTQYIVEAVGSHDRLQPGATGPLSEAYCRKTVQRNGLLGVQDAADEGFASDPAYERYNLGCYLGGRVVVNEELYGTLCFAGSESREYSFTESEQAFVELLVQWAGYELAQNRLEGTLRELQRVAGELMQAGSIDEIGDIAVESAEEILGLEVTGIWSYDEQQEALLPISETPAARELFGSAPRYEPGSGLTWTVFERGEKAVFEDVSTVQGRFNPDTDIRAEVIVPLGDQGAIATGSVSEHEFSDTDIELFELFGSTVTSAMLRMEREQTLQETRAKLERSNEDLEQFAYVASHDLQEPLRTVSSYLQLLERRYGEDVDEEGQEFIDFAVNGAERMSEMIQALLEYSRVDTRGEPLTPTSMDDVYRKAHQNLRVTIDETNATVTTDRLPTVQGDEPQLVRLFQNLLDNAIKYAGDTQPRVHVSAERTGSQWAFAVEDNGIGMTAKDAERVFQVFERLHSRESYAGTGIGLAMCRKIVDRHGGDIWVESAQGEGSTFHFTLPATTDD